MFEVWNFLVLWRLGKKNPDAVLVKSVPGFEREFVEPASYQTIKSSVPPDEKTESRSFDFHHYWDRRNETSSADT